MDHLCVRDIPGHSGTSFRISVHVRCGGSQFIGTCSKKISFFNQVVPNVTSHLFPVKGPFLCQFSFSFLCCKIIWVVVTLFISFQNMTFFGMFINILFYSKNISFYIIMENTTCFGKCILICK